MTDLTIQSTLDDYQTELQTALQQDSHEPLLPLQQQLSTVITELAEDLLTRKKTVVNAIKTENKENKEQLLANAATIQAIQADEQRLQSLQNEQSHLKNYMDFMQMLAAAERGEATNQENLEEAKRKVTALSFSEQIEQRYQQVLGKDNVKTLEEEFAGIAQQAEQQLSALEDSKKKQAEASGLQEQQAAKEQQQLEKLKQLCANTNSKRQADWTQNTTELLTETEDAPQFFKSTCLTTSSTTEKPAEVDDNYYVIKDTVSYEDSSADYQSYYYFGEQAFDEEGNFHPDIASSRCFVGNKATDPIAAQSAQILNAVWRTASLLTATGEESAEERLELYVNDPPVELLRDQTLCTQFISELQKIAALKLCTIHFAGQTIEPNYQVTIVSAIEPEAELTNTHNDKDLLAQLAHTLADISGAAFINHHSQPHALLSTAQQPAMEK